MKHNWDPFDQEFSNLTEKNVKKAAKRIGMIFVAHIVLMVAVTATVTGFVCWGIYKVVTHFAP